MDDDVEYVGLVAAAWDALRGDTSGWPDRAFYRRLVRERGEPVLDVGCGTGRLLLDFLADRVDIDGVDNSPDMLALLRRRAADIGLDVRGRIHHGRMEALALPRRYATMIVPSSSFQLLLERPAAEAALACFYDHLVPGGTLAMPFILFREAYDRTWAREAVLADGSTVRRMSRERYDPTTGIESTDDLYEVFRDAALVRSERHERPRATRAWPLDEIPGLLANAGFVELQRYSEFSWDPPRADDEVVTFVMRRPNDERAAA